MILRKCNTCGLEAEDEEQLESFEKDKKGKYGRMNRCKVCSSTRNRKTKQDLKMQSLIYLGGKCTACGIVAIKGNECIFDFHHIDPNTKSYTIGSTYTTLANVKEELDKCIVLCSNCHRMEHRHD